MVGIPHNVPRLAWLGENEERGPHRDPTGTRPLGAASEGQWAEARLAASPGLRGCPGHGTVAKILLWARRAGVTMWRVMVSEHRTTEKVLPSACLSFVETNQWKTQALKQPGASGESEQPCLLSSSRRQRPTSPQPVAWPRAPAALRACESKRKGEEKLLPPGRLLCSAHVSCGNGWRWCGPQLQAISVPTASGAQALELQEQLQESLDTSAEVNEGRSRQKVLPPVGLVPVLKVPSPLVTQEDLFPSDRGLNAAEEKLAADFRRMTPRSAPFSFEHPQCNSLPILQDGSSSGPRHGNVSPLTSLPACSRSLRAAPSPRLRDSCAHLPAL